MDEHIKAITELPQLQEIIPMLNADEAGEAATAKHPVTLKQWLPEIKIRKVKLPAGDEINSLLQSHDDSKILVDLVDQRAEFFFSSEKKNPETIITSAPNKES